MDNKLIRRTMRRYVKRAGIQETRYVIDLFASIFSTSKQRISGNISCMACIEGTITVSGSGKHRVMY